MTQQRAVDPEGKQARRDALLDAAERFLGSGTTKIPSVSEVAEAAGLAKGTVYLYFASKERLLQSLHERQIEACFDSLAGFLDARPVSTIEEVSERLIAWLSEHPVFVALSAHSRGAPGPTNARTAARGNPGPDGAANIAADRLARCVHGLDRASAEGMLWQSLALVVGLAQIGRPENIACAIRKLWRGLRTPAVPQREDDPSEASGAIRAHRSDA